MRQRGLTFAQAQAIGLLLIAVLLAAALSIARSPAATDFFCRWPHAFGILIGIVYWAWLWPSWLGILIAAASVALSLRFDWPGRSLRTEASTVLRKAQVS
jgi:chromate transport protein ChrA